MKELSVETTCLPQILTANFGEIKKNPLPNIAFGLFFVWIDLFFKIEK